MQVKRLYRASDDKVFFGVCGGIAEYFEVDSLIIRLLFALSAILAGSGLLVYIILAIVIPSEAKLRLQEEQASLYHNRAGARQPYGAASDAEAAGAEGDISEDSAGDVTERARYWNSVAEPQPPEQQKVRGTKSGRDFGVVLLGFGTILLMKVLLPDVDTALFFAIAFIALGIFLIVRKR